jgi:hypothetical protein
LSESSRCAMLTTTSPSDRRQSGQRVRR